MEEKETVTYYLATMCREKNYHFLICEDNIENRMNEIEQYITKHEPDLKMIEIVDVVRIEVDAFADITEEETRWIFRNHKDFLLSFEMFPNYEEQPHLQDEKILYLLDADNLLLLFDNENMDFCVSRALDTIRFASRKPEGIDFENSMKMKYTRYDFPSKTEINELFEPYLPKLRLLK